MSIVSAGVSEVQLKTLRTAIDGFCTTLKGSAFLNDLLTRAQSFSAGHSTSGEVPTFIVALGDQLALLWGYQRGYQVQGNSLDISSFSTSKFWRILFFRLLRDRLDSIFTAYCTPNDPEGDAKRRQKELDAEEFVEILVQGFHTSSDPFQLQRNPDLANWNSFFQQIGSYSRDPKHRPSGLNLESIKVTITALDDGVDLCSFFEEEALDKLSTFLDPNSTSSSSPDDSDVPPNDPVEILRVPSSVEDLIPSLLEFKRKLPERGSPATILSDEQILPSDSSPIDLYRKLVILKILKSLSRELQFIFKSSFHFVFQLSEGQCPPPLEEELMNSSVLFDLLEIEQNESGYLWLLSQIILAIKLRTNSRYRNDLEKLQPQTQTEEDIDNTATDALQTVSLQSLSPSELLVKYNRQITRKQLQHYEEMEQARRQELKSKYRRLYLTHPGNQSFEPLRIFSEEHLLKINSWTEKHRNFSIIRTKCPTDNSFTSMANNTYLTPFSRYFMTPCSPYHVCSIIYGSGVQRSHFHYYEHLHTFTRGLIQQVTTAGSGNGFELYMQLFNEHYSNHPKEENETILVDLWISFSFDQAVALLGDEGSSGYCDQLYSQLEPYVVDKDRLRSQITTEFLWHTNPEKCLDDYFTMARFQERMAKKPTLEEFLEVVERFRKRQVENEEQVEEDDLALASAVYAEEYQMDLEAGKEGLIA